MRYLTELYPYERPLEELSTRALKQGFAVVMEQLSIRISNISKFLNQSKSVLVATSSPDDQIDQLPELVAVLSHLYSLTEEEIESQLVGTRAEALDVMRSVLPKQALDSESFSMVFDAALLWGEVFRLRYPDARWTIGKKPTNSIDFGGPVLSGVDRFHEQFNPVREMHGHVGRLMLGMVNDWTLSKIMYMRAFSLGLGPDPRPGPMSDFEKERRGLA